MCTFYQEFISFKQPHGSFAAKENKGMRKAHVEINKIREEIYKKLYPYSISAQRNSTTEVNNSHI